MRIDDISSQTREETESLYEKIFAMTNELKGMNGRHDEDREEFGTFMKEYEVNRKERKGSDYTSFREDIRSLIQQDTKSERDLHDIQKSTKAIKHDSPQNFPETTIPESILSMQRDCSAGNNKLPRYSPVRKRHAHRSEDDNKPSATFCLL
jgi:hypothetical protein